MIWISIAVFFLGLFMGHAAGLNAQLIKQIKADRKNTTDREQEQKLLEAIKKDVRLAHAENMRAHSFNTICLQYCLTALRSYMLAMEHKAVEVENYEEAQECKNAVEAMEELIKFTNN